MGLFDSKKTKLEKEIYNKLNTEKSNSTYIRMDIGTISMSDFLKPVDEYFIEKKKEIIDKYNYITKIMGSNINIDRYDFNKFASCYDFVSQNYKEIQAHINKTKEDITSYLNNYDANHRVYLQGQFNDIMKPVYDEVDKYYLAPGTVVTRNMASEEADRVLKGYEDKYKFNDSNDYDNVVSKKSR